jgi:DNA-binding transcriptional LysR family regulator
MNDRLTALKLFVRVAQTRSFSAAGRELGFSQPSASRLIAALEQNVGAALFTRTTRAVTLTEAGASYLDRVSPILAALEEADHEARGTGELRGTLRVGVSSSLAIREVIPNLSRFMRRHPELRIELLMDDHRQDLVHDGVDVAIRFGALSDSTAVARRLISWPRVLVAAPSYLQRRGQPASPADLATHSVIVGPGVAPTSWSFRKDRRVMSVAVEGRLMVTVNEGAIAGAVTGLGIMSTVSAGCAREVASGALVRILADWDMGVVELHAILPSGKAAKPSAKAFADFLVDTLHA